MPTGALGESGLRTISSSMQMELSLCPLFQGNTGCQKNQIKQWSFRTVEEIEGWMAGDDSFMAHWK